MKTELPDGLYRVNTGYLTAGFEVKGGRVIRCAPILRKNFAYWKTIATRIERQSETKP